MTRKTRTIVFYVGIAVFIIASYVMVLYAQGYKYSFQKHRFFLTGAISLKANTDAKIFVNDTLAGSTSFLTNSFSIDRLLPGQYVIRLQRDGYSAWQKTVSVQEGMVVDFPKVLLLSQTEEDSIALAKEITDVLTVPAPKPGETIPFYLKNKTLYQVKNGTAVVLAKGVMGFAHTNNQDRLLWWTPNEVWVLWLTDTDYQPYHHAGDKELITRFAVSIQRATWFRDNDHIVLQSNGYRIIEIDKRGGINIVKI